MTDLEMTKLCAEAMRLDLLLNNGVEIHIYADAKHGYVYDPLHDDAQAMALVKRFDLSFCPRRYDVQGRHTVILHQGEGEQYASYVAANTDLNRAIVECVAKMKVGELLEAQ